MALKIKINNLVKKRKIPVASVKKAAELVLKKFGKRKASLDITFVSNSTIERLNKRYMGRKKPTDVLAFGLKKKTLVGDIYISSDMAERQSRVYKTNFRNEIILYTIHGVLHLAGLGDKTKKEKNIMRKLEGKFLERVT